jgi:hypothetical protein
MYFYRNAEYATTATPISAAAYTDTYCHTNINTYCQTNIDS